MRRLALIIGLAGLVALHATHAMAQASARGTVGVVRQGGMFGDDDPLSTSNRGLTFGIETRRAPEEMSGLAFDMAIPVRAVINPHFDERVRGIYLLVGAEIGRRTFVRLLGGGALGAWSGTGSDGGFSLMPAAGFGVGRHINVGTRLRVAPELVGRATVAVGVATWMVGVQVAISR